MRGSDLGPSGPPPGEGRTNRGDSRLKRIVLLVGVLGAFVMLAVGAIFAGAASAATEMNFACALKSNGLMRYVTNLNQCKPPKSEESVTIKPGPILTCVKTDGSVRKVSNCKPPAVQLTLPPASGTVYFCAASSTGVLRYVTDPSQCTSTESPVFVTTVNDAPVANNDAYSVNEGGTLNVAAPGVLGNDNDPDSGTLNAVLVSGPAHASSFTLDANGSFTYVHDGSETTSDSFTYKANDGTADSNVATVTITVTPVDDPPVAVNDTMTVLEDAAATPIDVLANDNDGGDGGPKTISSASDPAFGTVVLTGGTPGERTGLTYQPDPNYCNNPPGTSFDTFTYTLNGGSTATVSVRVNCVN